MPIANILLVLQFSALQYNIYIFSKPQSMFRHLSRPVSTQRSDSIVYLLQSYTAQLTQFTPVNNHTISLTLTHIAHTITSIS